MRGDGFACVLIFIATRKQGSTWVPYIDYGTDRGELLHALLTSHRISNTKEERGRKREEGKNKLETLCHLQSSSRYSNYNGSLEVNQRKERWIFVL